MFYVNYGLSFFGTILAILGVVALLTNLGVISAEIWKWWPILLIVLAIYIFALKKKKKKIVAGHLLHKITSDERVQEKIKKIIETADEVIDKKLDEWHEEATKEESEYKEEDENFGA
ncbi:MAG: hypothetical protein GF387_02515 [Candidatus Portnoybacteria bacterium]|nr:hypothetical protein [Candidatus Portnoybacteria bacterium]